MYSIDDLKKADPEIAESIERELNRQRGGLELIARHGISYPLNNRF